MRLTVLPDELTTSVTARRLTTGRAVIMFSDGTGTIRGPFGTEGTEGVEAVRRLSKSRRTRGGEVAGGGVV